MLGGVETVFVMASTPRNLTDELRLFRLILISKPETNQT